jgi:hypothetical protein
MTTKSIIIDCLSSPDRLGYNDRGTVLFDDRIVWHDSLRSSSTTWECINSPKHGKCLLLNDGAELPARYPNSNHEGRLVVSEVEVHCGETEDWPGSAACCTVAPSLWPSFIKYFELGDTGQIAIIEKTAAA